MQPLHVMTIAALLASGCTEGVVLYNVEGVTFVDEVDNPYFPLPSGASWTYEGDGEYRAPFDQALGGTIARPNAIMGAIESYKATCTEAGFKG